jgi:hypothetical protein
MGRRESLDSGIEQNMEKDAVQNGSTAENNKKDHDKNHDPERSDEEVIQDLIRKSRREFFDQP